MRNESKLLLVLVVGSALTGISLAQGEDVLDVQATPSLPGSVPTSVFKLDQDGGFVAFGYVRDVGNTTGCAALIPATGAGTRFMWDPCRGSVRFGRVPVGQTNWDDANMDDFTFAGGNQVVASGYGAFSYGDQVTVSSTVGVGFGSGITVSGTAGFSAGASNVCSGFACTAMGYTAAATGQGSVSLGYRTGAIGDYTVALGYRAQTCAGTVISGVCDSIFYTGAFIWADESSTNFFKASADNQFSIRAAGGVRMYTNAATTTGVFLSAGGSSWNVISDRNLKENFRVVDGESLLDRIAQLPLSTWRFKDAPDSTVHHIGPVAQDWQQFIAGPLALNSDSTVINQGDFDGVNLAAVKALERRTRELEAENERMRAEISALRQTLSDQCVKAEAIQQTLAAQLARLEAAYERLATRTERAAAELPADR
ncbi:MAG: hypothetical protein EHM23_03440 [Acidobacteria bacterium]|nr:MAG: hypothetical protein EHM23_03440 [Acidobacteriota bacterium]